jgi:hypothetical protein
VKVPVSLKIAALAVATTGFYTYVGQMVPQKEVLPPAEVALSKDMTQEQMRKAGREIMEGKGLCLTCHTIGKTSGPYRFPDLAGVGARAAHRVPGLDDVHYLAQSMYEPSAFIVPGFNPGMPTINKPPVGLTDDEILTVIAYLQSLGGQTTVTMQTKLPWQAGGGGAPEGTTGTTNAPGAGSTIAPTVVKTGSTAGSNTAAAEPATAAASPPGAGKPPTP